MPQCYIRCVMRQGAIVSLVCSLCFSLVAAAQVASYSADSLIAAFNKGSQTSLRGTEITFTGVIAEIRKSRVVFKSSGNDKINCELASPLQNLNEKGFVGHSLTVVGKVRGRGMMGNVTLDSCRLVDAVTKETVTAEAPQQEPEQPVTQAVEFTEPIPEPAPVPEPDPAAAAPVPAVAVPPKRPASVELARAAKAYAPPLATTPIESNNSEVAAPPSEVASETSTRTTARFTRFLPLLLAAVVGVGVGAFLTYMKFRPAGAARFRPTSSNNTPEDIRRAALEALLLGKKKRGSG